MLLQHTLRYVLSAQPQERADYFKAVLEVADLEIVRKEVGRLTVGLDGTSPDPTLVRLQELAAAGGFQGWDQRLRRDALSSAGPTESLAEATGIALSQAGSAFPADLDLAGRTALLADAVERRRAAVFPLRDLGAGIAQPDQKVDLAALTTYNEAMAQVDADSIRLAAIFTAVLALPRVAQATAALDCPVCETAGALTSARRAALREQASRSESVQVTVRNAVTTVSAARRYALNAGTAAKALPAAARWGDDDVARRRATLVALGDFGQLYDTAILAVRAAAVAAGKLTEAATALTTTIGEAEQKLRQRMTFPTAQLDAANNTVSGAWQALQTALTAHKPAVDALAVPVRPVLDRNLGGTGWVALLSLAATPDSLVAAVRREHAQTVVRQRLTGAEKSIETAIANVLDKRFSAMSGEVLRWWKTLRPDELVGFSGVQRRGTGKRFLDLKATLRPHLGGTPVSRDAIGIYSDSQLNALGLSAFLARSLIERSPLILLDDPIPNSDLEHRATFAMRTVPELLDTGIQLLITTFDPTLADLIRELHGHRGMDEFEVSLDDPPQGTVVVKRSDEFEWMMAKAKSQLRVGLEASRRTVAQDLRTAAERLAKLVIMAGRQKEGHPCLLTDFADKTLGELTPDVVAYAKTTDEPGRWRVLGRILNPGAHDAPAPQTSELVQVHGELRNLKKAHPEA